jgi:hypothetical protein
MTIDLEWLVRALRAAGYTDCTVEGESVELRDAGRTIAILLNDTVAALRFTARAGTSSALPIDAVERETVLASVQRELALARLAHYPNADVLMLEYDFPIVAGLSRPQFLTMLRGYLSDLAAVRRSGFGRGA